MTVILCKGTENFPCRHSEAITLRISHWFLLGHKGAIVYPALGRVFQIFLDLKDSVIYGIVHSNFQAHHQLAEIYFPFIRKLTSLWATSSESSKMLEMQQMKSPSAALHPCHQRDSVALPHTVLRHFKQGSELLHPTTTPTELFHCYKQLPRSKLLMQGFGHNSTSTTASSSHIIFLVPTVPVT